MKHPPYQPPPQQRVKYDIGDLLYYILEGLLAENWDHEDFILNLTYIRNAFYIPYAQCTNILVVHQGLQLQLDHHYTRFNTPTTQ